jgi:urea transporter
MANKQQASFIAISSSFKGIGQIMLQESAWTGLFFLAGIFCGSFVMGAAALLAVVVGTLTARLLKYNKDDTNAGLYGFSATLVGVALVFYFQPTVIIWLAIIPGSALATMIQHFFIIKKIAVFTFPFILVTWTFLYIFHNFYVQTGAQEIIANTTANNGFVLLSRGFGQVIFQSNVLAGCLFFTGILISRPIAAIYALGAAALSALIAYLLGTPLPDIYMGLLSYNAVLCAITFSGRKTKNIGYTLIAVILSVLITIQMSNMNLSVLTFPFVLASWLTLILKQMFRLKAERLSIETKE